MFISTVQKKWQLISGYPTLSTVVILIVQIKIITHFRIIYIYRAETGADETLDSLNTTGSDTAMGPKICSVQQ